MCEIVSRRTSEHDCLSAVFLLRAIFQVPNAHFVHVSRSAIGLYLTKNHTPEFALRIRLKTLPDPGDFDEFDLTHFRPGGIYVVPSHLASLLILSGYAELVDEHPRRAEAADFAQPRFPKRQ